MSAIDPPSAPSAADLRALAEQSSAWPFEQAKAIVARLKKAPKDEVLFETGYGPSGLPHIGTFGEVARTTMVRHAFRVLTEDKVKTRLLAFSDDMDGLRKVPDNVPNKEMLAPHLGKPLSRVPDPFSNEYPSFAAHNNARLRAFLDRFGFDYEFASATDYYTSGRFDAALLRMLERLDKVMAIMLPSLREERAASYSPFLPICPRTGAVLYVPIVAHDVKAGTISYDDPETKERVTLPVTGGHCKLQWKPDWAMRWFALGVDYEMAGKDLIDSVKLSGKICAALGGTPPEGFNYELFLDEQGQKISKSKGNGLTIDEWLRYASPESLSLFMYREPKAAKRLYFDVIPRNVDDYQQFLEGFPRQDGNFRLLRRVGETVIGHGSLGVQIERTKLRSELTRVAQNVSCQLLTLQSKQVRNKIRHLGGRKLAFIRRHVRFRGDCQFAQVGFLKRKQASLLVCDLNCIRVFIQTPTVNRLSGAGHDMNRTIDWHHLGVRIHQ